MRHPHNMPPGLTQHSHQLQRSNNQHQQQQQQQMYHNVQLQNHHRSRHDSGNYNRHQQQNDREDLMKDDYAGLMTAREKQWLLNIQMLQLNTGTPYFDDYYYTVSRTISVTIIHFPMRVQSELLMMLYF